MDADHDVVSALELPMWFAYHRIANFKCLTWVNQTSWLLGASVGSSHDLAEDVEDLISQFITPYYLTVVTLKALHMYHYSKKGKLHRQQKRYARRRTTSIKILWQYPVN
ncbi:hypothetical protein AVEN_119514-1 [Araneus ventricosus]|uniref:Uncharacterized protein n=1 Tax=Araneus ventricosus TaxID=182803 RepID=A0A4Y2M998_ARAVE|nr:hypothetical protein AVEN_119514-1 [Araneus ventricosus]